MSAGTRFVEIPAASLLTEMQAIAAKIKSVGGKAEQGLQGREVIFDFTPPGSIATIRIYTTLGAGETAARDCGEDAVRLVVGATVTVEGKTQFRTLTEPRKMLRTAPQDPEHHVRVRHFLDRVTEALREAYAVAAHVPTCPQCRGPMAEREARPRHADEGKRKFYGCLRFPECRGTRPF